jgi:hypothetical protein
MLRGRSISLHAGEALFETPESVRNENSEQYNDAHCSLRNAEIFNFSGEFVV